MDTSSTSDWLKEAKRNAGVLVTLGVIEIIVGVVALGSPFQAGIAVSLVVGIALVVAGITRLVGSLKAGSFGAGALALLSGLLAVGVGGYMVMRPGLGLVALTLVLAFYFFVDGIDRIVIGFKMKPSIGWMWSVIGGVIGLVLGVLIWRQFPVSGTWAVGTLVGIHLIISGWGLVGIGREARKGVSEAQQGPA